MIFFTSTLFKDKKYILFFLIFFTSLIFLLLCSTKCYSGTVTSTIAKKSCGLLDDAAKSVKSSIKKIKNWKTKPKLSTIGGSSVILRSRIATKPGYQAHHIIPVELKTHPALNKVGMDLDEVQNGISLPQYPGRDPILPLHRGSHSNYTFAVEKELDKIPDDLSVTETRKKISEVQAYFRSLLEAGTPLHTSQGGVW